MTRRAVWIAGSLVLALPLSAAWAQTNPPATPAPAPAASSADSSFIDRAAPLSTAEVQQSQLAETRAHRADVRSLAKTIARDHDWINEKLSMIAQYKKMSPPATQDDMQQQMMTSLQDKHGSAFDRQYLNEQATLHEQAIQLYRTESEQGTDPDLKAFAARVLPRLEQQLGMVEKLGGRPASSAS